MTKPPASAEAPSGATRNDATFPAQSLTAAGQTNADPAAAVAASLAQLAIPEASIGSVPPPAVVTPTTASQTLRSAAPVREIDVDLAPGGLDPLSMTMRLAGDRLSVVIRAGSGEQAGAIETARDAIAERLAAIGQPLASLVIQQTGGAGHTNHAQESSNESRRQSQDQTGDQSNDARDDRRGGGSRRR